MIRSDALVRLGSMSQEQLKVRMVAPERRQGVIRFDMPEDSLPAGHVARVLWTGELVNAHFMHRFGLEQISVRGLAKVTCVALLGGLAFNLLQHAAALLG